MLTKPTLLGHFASVLLLCSSSMVAMAETEPDNNTSNTADVINIGEPQTATISSVRDTDWFKFTVTQPGDYQIEVSGVGRDVDIALDLYASDATDATIVKDEGFDGDPETISFRDASPGNYLVKITPSGFFGTNTGYTLTLTDITKPKEAGSITLITEPNSLTKVVAGTTPSTVEFQLLNSEGNTAGMGDKPVSFTLTGPAEWTSPTLSNTTKTSTDGKFTFDWKDANGAVIPFTKAGEYTLAVAAEGQNKSVTVTIIPADPAKLTWVGTGTQPIEVPTYIIITPSLAFEVRDQYKNLVKAGQTIDVQIIKPDATSMAPDSSSSLTTDANGQVEVVFTPDQAVNYTIKALSSSTEVMSSLPTLVGQVGEDNTSVTFTLTDKNGKGIDRQPLDVSLPQQPTGGTASLEPSGALTTKDGGKVAVSLKEATVAGEYTVSAKLSVPNSKIKDSTGAEQDKIEVKVSVAATAPDSLTVKDGGTQTISGDTASAQITFELKAGVNPIGETLEVTLSKEPSQHKACLVNAETALCDANNLVTTLSVTTDAISGEGSVWLKDAKLAGEYTITASLSNSSATSPQPAIARVTVTPGIPKQLVVGDNKPGSSVQHIAIKKAEDEVIKLTDQYGNAMENGEVKVEVSLNGNPLTPAIPNSNISNGTFRLPATTFAEVGKYTVKVTLDPNPPVEMVVEVGNLAVTEGGNQTVLVSTEGGKSEAITLTLNDGAGGDEIFKTSAGQAVKDKTVTLTLTDDSLGNPVTGLGLVEEGKNDGIPPQNFLTLSTNAKGEVKIIFQAPPATVVPEAEPVAAYKITAQVNGLEEYTEVFVVTKAVKELVETDQRWPSLAPGESLNKNDDTACSTGGWAWNARGKPQPTTAAFYGGLKKGTEAFLATVPEVRVDQVNRGEGGDQVVVQGVIKVDDKDKVEGLFVLGENGPYTKNDSTEKGTEYVGTYMLGKGMGDIRLVPVSEDKLQIVVDQVTAFRRGVAVSEGDYILLEMYRGAFFYPTDSLKLYFGYYTKDDTIVHNCTPIEVRISE